MKNIMRTLFKKLASLLIHLFFLNSIVINNKNHEISKIYFEKFGRCKNCVTGASKKAPTKKESKLIFYS